MAKIISGNNCRTLGKQISKSLGLESIEAKIERFADGELRLQLCADLHKEDVVIVQSTHNPANDNLIALLMMVDAAKRAGSKNVTALVPYFGYSRQDKSSYEGGPISARLVSSLLESSGVDRLITLDLHSKQSEEFFKIEVQNLDPSKLFASIFKGKENLVVVSPDFGGVKRAKSLASILDTDIAVINKIRKSHNICQMSMVSGEVLGKNCIIFDDIVDTGNTLCQAANLLKKRGALSIEAVITHGVLSNDAVAKIESSAIERIMITDSIPLSLLPSKFSVINASSLFIDALQRSKF